MKGVNELKAEYKIAFSLEKVKFQFPNNKEIIKKNVINLTNSFGTLLVDI